MNKVCEECGQNFEGADWQRICKSCFAKSKKAEQKKSEELHLTIESVRIGALDASVKTHSVTGGAEPEVIIETAMRYEKYIITGE